MNTNLARGKAPPLRELIGAVAWLAFGGFLFWQSFLLKGTHVGAAEGIYGPVFYPRLLGALIMLLACILLSKCWLAQHKTVEKPGGEGHEAPDLRLSAVALVGLLLYTFLLERVGFLILTPLMLFALMWLMGERRWWLMAVSSTGLCFGLYIVFRFGVRVLLPEGWLY